LLRPQNWFGGPLMLTMGGAPDRFLRKRHDVGMNETRSIDPTEDPVCGMSVDPEAARAKGLTLTHDGREYAFCGRGCLLDFKDEPAKFLDPSYRPSM
jgi:YHS domain-containing protein